MGGMERLLVLALLFQRYGGRQEWRSFAECNSWNLQYDMKEIMERPYRYASCDLRLHIGVVGFWSITVNSQSEFYGTCFSIFCEFVGMVVMLAIVHRKSKASRLQKALARQCVIPLCRVAVSVLRVSQFAFAKGY